MKPKKKIYLACPYRHENQEIAIKRFDYVNQIAGQVMMQGHVVFSPISHSHPIACRKHDLPVGWEFWSQQDLPFLEWADELWVATFPGWHLSEGVRAEILAAGKLRKPIVYIRLSDYLSAENIQEIA